MEHWAWHVRNKKIFQLIESKVFLHYLRVNPLGQKFAIRLPKSEPFTRGLHMPNGWHGCAV
jgi:hypothetical protein